MPKKKDLNNELDILFNKKSAKDISIKAYDKGKIS